MKKNVLALSIKAMIGGLGFAGADDAQCHPDSSRAVKYRVVPITHGEYARTAMHLGLIDSQGLRWLQDRGLITRDPRFTRDESFSISKTGEV